MLLWSVKRLIKSIDIQMYCISQKLNHIVHHHSRSKQYSLARIKRLLLRLQWIVELQKYLCILALLKCIKLGHRRPLPPFQLIWSKIHNLKEDLLQDLPNSNYKFQANKEEHTQNQQDSIQLKQEKKTSSQEPTGCWNTTQKSTGTPMGCTSPNAHPLAK